MSENKNTFDVVTQVPYRHVLDWLVGAFEGGSNYWVSDLDWNTLKLQHEQSPYADQRLGSVYTDVMAWCLDNNEHFNVRITSFDDEASSITPTSLKNGVQAMATYHPRHYSDMITEAGDAITSDVLLQCVLYQQVLYG